MRMFLLAAPCQVLPGLIQHRGRTRVAGGESEGIWGELVWRWGWSRGRYQCWYCFIRKESDSKRNLHHLFIPAPQLGILYRRFNLQNKVTNNIAISKVRLFCFATVLLWSLFSQCLPLLAHHLVLTFVIMVNIVIINLTVALAIKDMDALAKTAQRTEHTDQIILISHDQKSISSKLFQKLPSPVKCLLEKFILKSAITKMVYPSWRIWSENWEQSNYEVSGFLITNLFM